MSVGDRSKGKEGKEGGAWEEERMREEWGGDTSLGTIKSSRQNWNKFSSTIEPTDLFLTADQVPVT